MGLQCLKALWLARHRPDLRTPPDEARLERFRVGREVGILARGLFPGGVAVDSGSVASRLRRTGELVKGGAETIYEAAFRHEDLLIMADILHRGSRGWELYEVKSGTKVEDVHIDDVAVQYHVLTGWGLEVASASVVHVDCRYVRRGKIDVHGLFAAEDVTAMAAARRNLIVKRLADMRRVIAGECPAKDIGPHCFTPYVCDFKGHCWAHIPEYSVFNISNLGMQRKFELYYAGVVDPRDIPGRFRLSEKQRMEVEAELTGREYIDREAIRRFLDTLHYPLYFLDFETFQQPVPPFEGVRPYQKIPFQYSLHFIERKGAPPGHFEFLAREGMDDREEIARRLVEQVPEDACVVTYNMAFEKDVLRGLAADFPRYAGGLMKIHDGIRDLMIPFRQRSCYTRRMKGSHSIKAVLPALVTGLGYDGMEVADGEAASRVFASLHRIKDPDEVKRLRKALLDYCRLDTLAMVRLLERLRELSGYA